MTKRFLNAVKTIFVLSFIFFGVLACEKEFEEVGVGLVDNNLFDTKDTVFNVITYNVNIDSTRVDNNTQYLLGIYNDTKFGYFKSSFISQLTFLTADFGENVSIDAVVLDIPYYATALVDSLNLYGGKPFFQLDSIIGDRDLAYDLSVYELGTYLNTLDPADPSKPKKYYSNDTYTKKNLIQKLEGFKPNANDTVLYIERRYLDADVNTVDDIDTIKKSDLKPSIKIPLDTAFFRTHFVEQQETGVFDSNQNFIDYFRGVIIEPEGMDGSMMTLAMTGATITIYYTNDVLTDESVLGVDLNGDGDTDDTEVPVRTKQTTEFILSGQKVNKYERDYSSAEALPYLINQNQLEGDDKLYIQGASGSMAVIELFRDIDIDEIRNEKWLINEANLIFYVDDPQDTILPEQLFIYNYDTNSQFQDNITEAGLFDQTGLYGYTGTGGILISGDTNERNYKFSITDYISDLLKEDSSTPLHKLGLKTFNPTDVLVNEFDTIVESNSWRPKGVVLKGSNSLDINRVKLQIFYTKNNN